MLSSRSGQDYETNTVHTIVGSALTGNVYWDLQADQNNLLGIFFDSGQAGRLQHLQEHSRIPLVESIELREAVIPHTAHLWANTAWMNGVTDSTFSHRAIVNFELNPP